MIENEIDVREPTPDAVEAAEQAFRSAGIAIPDGYEVAGIAWASGRGPTLFIAGPGVPAMVWDGERNSWRRAIEVPVT